MEKGKRNWLYEFESKETVKKENGETDLITRKFAILKPNRRMKEDGELFFAAETSRYAKAGVLPKAAWNTILSNGGGSISDQDREFYGSLLIQFRDKSFELQSILFKTESEKTDIEKKRSDELIVELEEVRKQIQSFESSQLSIFENTAEAKARNRTILWWLINTAYEEVDGNYVQINKGDNFEEKLDYYDMLEEDEAKNEFRLQTLRRLTYLVTLWYLGRANNKEDFELFDKEFSKGGSTDDNDVVEEVKTTEEIKTVE